MGFLSGILGSPAKSSGSSVQGYKALSPNAKQALDDIAYGARTMVSPITHRTGKVNQENIDRFTPLGQTADATSAFDILRAGTAPTAASINTDMSMMMNPFNSYVTDEINRNATGDYSILKKAISEAGQMGSNRQILGASEIEGQRLRQGGLLAQDQFNTNMGYIMNQLPALRVQDAEGRLGIDEYLRTLDWNTKQAPVNALLTATQLAQGSGLSGAQAGSGTSANSSTGKDDGLIGKLGSAATAISMFSDRRLKENIEAAGEENGHKVYSFNYKGDDKRFIGVMADEVEVLVPDAVEEVDGYLAVDYSKIGVRFREVIDAVV